MDAVIAFVLVAAVLMVVILLMTRPSGTYVWDDSNPFRRYCRRCGQQQDQHEQGHSYWAAMGHVFDPACECHKDCE